MKQQFSSVLIRILLCGAAITLISASPVTAQSDSTVLVSNSPNSINPIIVTATRTPTKASDVLADNVYIGPEEIQQSGQTTLTELLQRQKGVTISSYGGGGSNASVFLRGTTNNQTLVLIDGVRVDDSFNGGANWAVIPLSTIDHIEIVFGPQSSLYGADAIGGVIQIFTKSGDGPPKVGASIGYGTYGTSISEASINGSSEGDQKIRYALAASQTLSMGFNTIASNNKDGLVAGSRTGYVQDSVTGKLSQEWRKDQEVGLQFLQSRINNQLPSLNGQDGAQQVQNQISQLGTYSLYSKNKITGIWQSLLQASAQTSNALTHSPSTDFNSAYDSTLNQRQNIYTWQNDIAIGRDTLQILAERRTQTVSSNQLNYNSAEYPFPLLGFSQSRNTNSGAAAYQMKHDSSIANFSIRNDSITGYGPQNTGSAAYGYFFTKEWRTNINYGTGFRAPTFNDLYYPGYGNPNIQPEKSKNTEAGLHYERPDLEGHIVAFSNSISNLIQVSKLGCPLGTNPSTGCASNVSSANITGASVSGMSQIANLSLKGSFTQQNPVNQGSDSVLIKQAKQYGNIAAEYMQMKFTGGIGATFSGRRNDYLGTNTGMGGYTIYNLYANYEVEKNLSIFARWNNVFNKDYQLSYGYNTPGSNFFAGVRYAMK
ncbi:TonB-dependent receptor domain-containing protein [Polynucleobacter sp. CS-Odin-A6]|uniref:TonB-dependent receptor domain-containing protein n=1 Tax=Polynucleobacter sp. CS-Odin-A6 TaxID=2689106 RepID=UPI001C0B62C7|nr:TonB-dependent receptor [Polynucleobacter sp. CS-Odin-A6]MBU3620982.1 TonB-dependent receptor [Polynucleobacter sp. CS-Odin-A6]